MARRREEEAPKGSPAWMTTFSDLMNLLLCFFVLLFSMSTVDADKWEEVVNSMTSSFSLWKGGYTSIGEGLLISAGTSQMSELGDFYTTMGEQQEETDGEQMIDKSLEEKLQEANQKETEAMLDNIAEKMEDDELDNIIDVGGNSVCKFVTFKGTKIYANRDALPLIYETRELYRGSEDDDDFAFQNFSAFISFLNLVPAFLLNNLLS